MSGDLPGLNRFHRASSGSHSVPALTEPRPTDPDYGAVHPSIWLGFVPWILFAVLCRRDTLQAAVVVGLVGALLVSLPSVLAGRPKLLELGTVLFFVVFVLIVFAVDPGADDFLNRYGRAIATGGLALIAAVSLLIDRPFTEQYAREQVDPSLWESERFRRLNRQFTAAWALVFLLMACSHIVAGAIDTHRAETIFNWVIPIALIIAIVKYMAKERATSQTSPRQMYPLPVGVLWVNSSRHPRLTVLVDPSTNLVESVFVPTPNFCG